MRVERPNILFLLPDQHRPDFLGVNPELPVRTPHLDTLAARGIRFTNAITPSPLCAPARACLAAGRRYDTCGVPGNDHDYPLQQPTYYAALRDAGYEVAGVGKFDLHKATHDWGADGTRHLTEWGFTIGVDNEGKIDAVASGAGSPRGPYMAYLHQHGLAAAHVADFRTRHPFRDTHPTPLPDEAYCDNWIAENGLRLLHEFASDRPWHLVVNFTGPHSPMDVTATMRDRWRDVDFPQPHANDQWDEETHQQIRRNYAAMIENIDHYIGRLIAAVDERGEGDRTLIIFSSDHGEMLGDHGLWGKKSWRRASVGIPLIIAGPDVRRGVVSEAPVELQDVTATMLDVAGSGPLPEMEARSLRPLLTGKSERHREVAVSGIDAWRLAFDGRYKLVLEQGIAPRLYDLHQDPWEDMDIAMRAPAEVARLHRALIAGGVPDPGRAARSAGKSCDA
ncbi:MAG: sulfatase-like hydrolase/transferase [Chloroflexia bacterium]|nr:sulfatase-like hydrolase/transferase [Chloroflexia bacterium]